MKEKNVLFCRNSGITLIALVITIIILLILAGISISSLTGSGLFQKAQESTRISQIKEIEEAARLSYMERQIDEIDGGENATISGVISNLREKGYTIKEVIGSTNSITGVKLNKSEISMEKNATEEIAYEYESGTTVRYFTEVQGKNYEIIFNNGEITVSTVETDLTNIDKLPEVTVTSSNGEIVEAQKTEEGKITLTSKDNEGEVTIIVTCAGKQVECKVTVFKELEIGDYVVYDVVYTDMRTTKTLYDNSEIGKYGWRILDLGEYNEELGRNTGIKLISTGIPANLSSNWITSASWWYGSGNESDRIVNGLRENFENIPFKLLESGDAGDNNGYYRNEIINNDHHYNYNINTGAMFLTTKANKVSNLSKDEINKVLEREDEHDSRPITGKYSDLFCLNYEYQIAYRGIQTQGWGGVGTDNNYVGRGIFNCGVRPVITLNNEVKIDKKLNGAWIIE